ncbi:hemin-degrading factor [Rhodoferax saidenbachensis]|uniref:Hemin-degrading factor n=1 Tax=Rhodoferax saidenbachensis TaxID=1484693 RepID=A0A1P8K9A1_9BURK|nr:hemin-degrading factor [Rhodoferax saidenbachensis]APW42575.1 hemin-degrading factor [Rhodoferax saidenbachensis]
MSAVLDTLNPADLRERFTAARNAGKRARDAAHAVGVSEGAVLDAHTGEHAFNLKVISLQGPWLDVLQGVQHVGEVMALTRNESTVHEKTGVYENVSANGGVGIALGEVIDLRLFFMRWHAGYAVTELANDPANPPSQSLQFYDAHGDAVHKIFVRPGTDLAAFKALVDKFAVPGKSYAFTPAPAPAVARPDADIDATGLAEGWANLKDTHEFFGLLRKFDVQRQQALAAVEGRFTARLETTAVRHLLDEAAMEATPIMVFVGNPGCIQIHSGPVKRIEPMVSPAARWINVLDAGFNLHLREDMIVNIWAVEKPTADGVVTSIEVFDAREELMVQFFGVRKPGLPELQSWRDLVAGVPRLGAKATASV